MRNSLLLAVGAIVAFFIAQKLLALRKNITIAKQSGLPYIVAPWWPSAILWQAGFEYFYPVIKSLPSWCWKSWLEYVHPEYAYEHGYSIFGRHGGLYLLVSPGGIVLLVANADANRQITTRRDDFTKHTEVYGLLDLFGRNVVSTDGAEWRLHRKVTSTTFNEKNAALVFQESIHQTQEMIRKLTDDGQHFGKRLSTVQADTMRLAMHVISYVGFGLRFAWPGQPVQGELDPRMAKYISLNASQSHKMSFVDAVSGLIDTLVLNVSFSARMLRCLPFKRTQLAAESREEFVKYMDELMADKLEDARKDESVTEGMDLMGQLVRASHELRATGPAAQNSEKLKSGSPSSPKRNLSRSDVLGNAFIMLIAGHETSANMIHWIMLELALNPKDQRHLQKDVDELVGDSDPATWDFEKLVNPMMGSMLGATLNETLRLTPPAPSIPKIARTPQPLTVDGKEYVIPGGIGVWLSAMATQRNPQHWPSLPSKISPGKDDLDDWVPERWFRQSIGPMDGDLEIDQGEDFGGYRGSDTSAQLFRPEPGAYIPFSSGARSCLGRRIAQVEIMAAIAVIFQKYSVELAVDEWMSDAELESKAADRAVKAGVYSKAQAKARETMAGARTLITLQMRDGKYVPIKLVRRGEEKFVSWLE